MPRLFAAIELSGDIGEALSRLREPLPGARWVDPANYHVTLKFFGDVDQPTAREISHVLANVESHAFEVRCLETGVFGGNDPHALWAGVDGGEPLMSLQRDVEKAARRAGLKPEKRSFHPHITLARLQHTPVEAVARYLERHSRLASPFFTVSRFVVMSSRPHVGGGPYGIEEAFPLIGADWDDGDQDVGETPWSRTGDD